MGYDSRPGERDSSVKKVASSFSPKGAVGQKYLASGKAVSMRLWEEDPAKRLAGTLAPMKRLAT